MSLLNLKPAASGMSHHSFDVTSISSLDFGELLPVRVIETVKRDHFTKVSGNGILRLAPQVFPTYGKAFVKTAAFFVPEYQLIESSDAFHSNMNSWKGNSVVLPHFNSLDINDMFASDNTLATQVGSATTNPISGLPSIDSYDFTMLSNPGSTTADASYVAYKLTRKGQYYYKILKSLGYDFTSFSYDSGNKGSVAAATGNFVCNALPLLAYAKIYCDFFLNPQQYNNHTLVSILNSIQFNRDAIISGTTYYVASTGTVPQQTILYILGQVLLPHQGSRYLDAWNTPLSPNGDSVYNSMIDYPTGDAGLISPVHMVASSYNDVVASNNNGAYLTNSTTVQGSMTTVRQVSAFGLKMLRAFDTFVRRRGLSGNKAVERIYSAFGIKSDFFSSHYCHKIFDSASRLDFNPVLSNSDTVSGANGMRLGSFAGYCSSGLNFSFEHKCDSFGYIIVLSWIQVVPMLMRGFDPHILRSNPLDFYTPEYDGTTLRAIPQCELSVCKNSVSSSSTGNTQRSIFGYMNLYDDYRFMRDNISGDFLVSANARSFLFGRDLSVLRNATTVLHPQTDVVHYFNNESNPDMTEVFQVSKSLGDRFYLQIDFHIEADRPIKSETDSIDLNGEGDLQFSMNGNSLS